jgi:hypothetical protein
MSQIFIQIIPIGILFSFFQDICEYNKELNIYIYNYISYRKSIHNNTLKPFLLKCAPYYRPTKQNYVNINNISYGLITTVIRQICNINGCKYKKINKYNKTKSDIEYTIYLNKNK